MGYSIEEAVKKRYSVRNYSSAKLDNETREEIKDFISKLENPFDRKIKYIFFDKEEANDIKTPGTYGVIKGANHYVGASIKNENLSLFALGYELETAMLFMTSIGIGTCWLGGTFDRKEFFSLMNVEKDEILPIISPYGYPADKKHLKERAMRRIVKADRRKETDELFFEDDFATQLNISELAEDSFALEMVRLGPSASNKQPWRIVKIDSFYHFYEYKEPGYSNMFSYDIQKIDMGIAAAHFHLAMMEKGRRVKIILNGDPNIKVPKNIEYVFSWMKD